MTGESQRIPKSLCAIYDSLAELPSPKLSGGGVSEGSVSAVSGHQDTCKVTPSEEDDLRSVRRPQNGSSKSEEARSKRPGRMDVGARPQRTWVGTDTGAMQPSHVRLTSGLTLRGGEIVCYRFMDLPGD